VVQRLGRRGAGGWNDPVPVAGKLPAAHRARSAGASRDRPQQRFDLLDYPIFFLAHIVARFDNNAAFEMSLHGFSQSDWRIIATLQYADDLTLTELARITTLERSFVGRIVGDLEKRGLLLRSFPANDRRTTRVSLTKEGRVAFQDVLLPATSQQLANALDGIGESDRAVLYRVLRHMMLNVYHSAQESAPILDDEDPNT
jgi:DNA-binding MarR family transcriptional regulator